MPDSSVNTRILQPSFFITPTATDPTLIHALLHTTFLNPEVLMEGQCTLIHDYLSIVATTLQHGSQFWNMSNAGWRLTVLIMIGHQY